MKRKKKSDEFFFFFYKKYYDVIFTDLSVDKVNEEDNPDYSEIEDKGIKAPYEFNMEEEIEESKDEEISTQGPVGSTASPSRTQSSTGSITQPSTLQGQSGNTQGTQQPPVDNNPPIERPIKSDIITNKIISDVVNFLFSGSLTLFIILSSSIQ